MVPQWDWKSNSRDQVSAESALGGSDADPTQGTFLDRTLCAPAIIIRIPRFPSVGLGTIDAIH
jgi:hypothetical protein